MTAFNSSIGPGPAKEFVPERVPLAALAALRGPASPALARVLCSGAGRRGPGRVVAGFQSSV